MQRKVPAEKASAAEVHEADASGPSRPTPRQNSGYAGRDHQREPKVDQVRHGPSRSRRGASG